MAAENKVTFKARQQALIDRTPPYDGNALVQKTEDDEVRDIGTDSQVFEIPTQSSINAPTGAFNVNFDEVDEVVINTTASIPSAFIITLQNLNGNKVGKIAITKKTGDTFVFGNGQIVAFAPTEGQTGQITLSFSVTMSNGNFIVTPTHNFPLESWVNVTPDPSGDFTIDTSNGYIRRNRDGKIECKGYVTITRNVATPFVGLFLVAGNYLPSVDRGVVIGQTGIVRAATVRVSDGLALIQSEAGTNTYYLDNVSYYL